MGSLQFFQSVAILNEIPSKFSIRDKLWARKTCAEFKKMTTVLLFIFHIRSDIYKVQRRTLSVA